MGLGGIRGYIGCSLDWKESSVGAAPTSSGRLFHSGIVRGGGGGCCRNCVSTSCERADHRSWNGSDGDFFSIVCI